jgi:flagellar protein FlbD
MIELSRINGMVVHVNPDLIRYLEETPDTVLTFTDGEKLMVKEHVKEVVEKIVRFRRLCAAFVEKE